MGTLNDSLTRTVAPRSPSIAHSEMLFLLFILIIPLANSPPMQAHIVELPGAKLTNLIAMGFAFYFFSGQPRLLRSAGALERNGIIAFLAYLAVFLISFLRSVHNLPKFHGISPDSFPSSAAEYALTCLMVPLIIASTYVYVLKSTRTRESAWRLLATMGASIFILSCIVIVAVVSRPAALSDPTRDAMAALTGDVLGLHYNSVGTIYIVAGPILLYLSLKRGGFWTVNYFIALVAVVLLESRTALFIIVAMSAVTLIALGRGRTLLALAPLVIFVAAIAAGTLLVQLVTIGFTAHSGLSITRFLSGRDEQIWLPLIVEWWSDPLRFWFGAGEYGVLSSFMLASGVVPPVDHSHNAYLDFFFDNGLVLESVLLGAIATFLAWSWRTARRIRSELFWVLLLCVVSFLIAGMTGRHFYPDQEDTFLFPVLALMINLARSAIPEKQRAGGAQAAMLPSNVRAADSGA